MTDNPASPLPALPLPEGISSRQIDTTPLGGLSFHILEAGASGQSQSSPQDRPLILLLHGFPELAFSWRKIMLPLAEAGYYVVAPDQRGYGRTTGWDNRDFADVDLCDFSPFQLIRDMILLVHALGYGEKGVKCLVGHDFGAVSAVLCAIARPDFFKSVVLMSHPFKGMPKVELKRDHLPNPAEIHTELASLGRKHYKAYYSTPSANSDMTDPPQGLKAFLRGYFHLKSASWQGNQPHPLRAWTATELVNLPHYYVMPLDSTMPGAVEGDIINLSSPDEVLKSHSWMPDPDLDVYVSEFGRTGFQGGFNWYRVHSGRAGQEPGQQQQRDPLQYMDILAGKKIECPATFICGDKDWGMYQDPGAVERMGDPDVCADFRGRIIVKGAGHWVMQEKPDEVVRGILEFIRG